MSEELMQVVPTAIGRFYYYQTGGSNLATLYREKIVSKRTSEALSLKKPDGLIVTPDGAVVAAIEYKKPEKLKTKAQINKAIEQELAAAGSVCKILIVTDNTKTFWINAQNGKPITDAQGNAIKTVFNIKKIKSSATHEEIKSMERLLDLIENSISTKCNAIGQAALLDPAPLAKSLWQKIWVSTGKEPEKCLYNVVELFIFKFLSDLNVLQSHLSFEAVYKIRKESSANALEAYANTSRKEIKKLFPAGSDGTTVINGTIFVNEKGEPNLAQSTLFGDVLDLLHNFDRKSGSFRHIQREFKTRLYESFLRQSAGVKALGQYFTPRNVVRAMVQMASLEKLPQNAHICDPFCGVGGFLLETIVESPKIFKQFEPRNGVVRPQVTIIGYDKGSDEKDDERTIILAKANMLIYFSDIIAKHHTPSVLKEFSNNAFNKVFQLIRSNLGTFSKIEEERYDLILTNPPYVTSGVSTIRNTIKEEALGDKYTCNGRGTEALSIEWIVRSLVPGGQALVVVPDGLLTQHGVLKFISGRCIINGIVSLPEKTFYSTNKKTYIIIITKKESDEDHQSSPVFTYRVNEIGETRDVYRFQIDKNDLLQATSLFNQFKGSPIRFATDDINCRLVSFAELEEKRNWLFDKWDKHSMSSGDSCDCLVDFAKEAKLEIDQIVAKGNKSYSMSPREVDHISLGGEWMEYVTSKTGWTKTQYRALQSQGNEAIPVYSAAKGPVAYVEPDCSPVNKIIASKEHPLISFAANGDGSAGANFIFHTSPFYISNDRTCIKVIDKGVDPEFIFFSLHGIKEKHGFNHSFKATKENLCEVEIPIPVNGNKFNLPAQREKVEHFKIIFEAKISLERRLKELQSIKLNFNA